MGKSHRLAPSSDCKYCNATNRASSRTSNQVPIVSYQRLGTSVLENLGQHTHSAECLQLVSPRDIKQIRYMLPRESTESSTDKSVLPDRIARQYCSKI